MVDHADGPWRTFLHDLLFDFEASEFGLQGTVTLTPEMLTPEADRPLLSVLATVADVFTGMPVTIHRPGTVALTVDLVLRLLRPVGAGRYPIESTVVKYGRTVIVTEAVIRDDRGPIAHCWATFVPFSVPNLAARTSTTGPRIGGGGLRAPFIDAVGVRVVAPGVAEVDKTAYTLQPAGTIQGGALCALVEAAGRSVLDRPLADIDLRFRATVKHGPARATAVALDEQTARVTVVDAGDNDRMTAVGLARSWSEH
jgi:acyl-coenzyme A thioesterase PaaI-like protein